MPASPVKPEFGPTLPELLRPRLTALPRAARVAVVTLLVLAAVGLAALVLGGSDAQVAVVRRAPVAFNFHHPPALRPVAAGPGETLRLEQRRGELFLQSFAVEPLTLPAYRGQASGELPAFASGYAERLARRHPGFRLVEEGKTRINEIPGYALAFSARLGERRLYGRHVLLVPDEPGARRGVALVLLATPAAGVHAAQDAGATGALKRTLRSFRFGVEAP